MLSAAHLAASPILPTWMILPLGGVMLLVIAAHVVALQFSELAARRKRIRTAAGILMMLVTALIAYALGVLDSLPSPGADPAGARLFVLTWIAIVSLLFMVIALAVADLAHGARDAAHVRRALQDEMRERLVADILRTRSEAPRPAANERTPRD